MFSVITNNYNKKIKGPNLMEFFTATGILFLYNKRCSMCAPRVTRHATRVNMSTRVSPVVHISKICSCQKKLFQFSCGCEKVH